MGMVNIIIALQIIIIRAHGLMIKGTVNKEHMLAQLEDMLVSGNMEKLWERVNYTLIKLILDI
jgi:hypothetical protein